MKRIALFAILLAITFCGCVKSDDFDALGHDIEFTGQLRPSLGFPIGQSFMGIADLLGSWQSTSSLVSVDDNGFISFVYSDTLNSRMNFVEGKGFSIKSGSTSKSGPIVTKYTQHYSGEISIDLFNNIADEIDLIGTYIDLRSYLKAYGHNDFETLMSTYNVKAYFTNLTFTMEGSGGSSALNPDENSDTITVEEMVAGHTIVISDHEDLSNYLSLHPDKIRYNMDFIVEFDLSSIATSIIDTTAYIQTQINLDSITTSTTISANFPLQIRTTSFTYAMDVPIDLSEVGETIESFRERISFGDSSYLALRFVNKLPFSFLMSDLLYDENNNIILSATGTPMHLYGSGGLIESPHLKDTLVGGQTYYISDGIPVETVLKTNIGEENIDILLRTHTMKLNITVTSGPTVSGGAPAHVTVRDNDKLETDIYVVTNPATMSK